MKHTKGKWKIHRLFEKPLMSTDDDGKEWYHLDHWIMDKNNKIVCETKYSTAKSGWGLVDKLSEMEANAKLIAAAPELLEAAQELINMTEFPEWANNALNKLEEAIKKATS